MRLSLLRAAEEVPEHPALVTSVRTLTYASLARRVRHATTVIEARAPGDGSAPIALSGESTVDTLVALFAAFELGRPALLLHPRWSRDQRQSWLDRAGLRDSMDVRGLAEAREPPLHSFEPRDVDPETPLVIVPTSGTAGASKGIVLSRRAFEASADASAKNLGWREDDRWLLSLPVAHVGGLSVVTRCLIARKTVVLAGESPHSDTADLIRRIERHRVTLLSLVPTQLHRWLEHGPAKAPACLRAILLGGARPSPSLLEKAADRGFPVLTTYGLTEACSQVTTQRYGTLPREHLGAGRPLAGIEVRIRKGVIQVRGRTLLSGYYPDAHQPPLDAEGWFSTGDHGFLDDEGNLHVLGRGTELIITGGENVYPSAVEEALVRCPGIREACVFGVEDAEWGQIVAAALVTTQAFDPETLARFCEAHLATHERPRRYTTVEALPLTASGKLDRPLAAQLPTRRLARTL